MGADYKHKRRDHFTGGTDTNLGTGGSSEAFPIDYLASATAANLRQQIAPFTGVCIRSVGRLSAAPGGAATRTFTLMVNGAPTADVLIFQPADLVAVWTGEVAFNENDNLHWNSDGGVGVPANAHGFATMVCIPL